MKGIPPKIPITLLLSLFTIFNAHSQCNYKWATWSSSAGQNAQGSIQLKNHTVGIQMTTNYNTLELTSDIYYHFKFDSFSEPTPNLPVPAVTWSEAAGMNGTTTICFSEKTHNPVLLISSLGQATIPIKLTFSQPYTVLLNSDGMTYNDNTSLTGEEGYAIIMFPGDFTCINVSSSNSEYYSNINWGINEPAFPVTITETARNCKSVTLQASGGVSYTWSDGLTQYTPENTFIQSAVYVLTVKDDAGCAVTTSTLVTIVNQPEYKDTTVTICANQSYNGHDQSGTYQDKFTNQNGCDSICRLTLIVKPPVYATIEQTICAGTIYQGYSTTGIYIDTLAAYNGCDSIRTIHLLVNQPGIADIHQSICEGESYEGYHASGDYTDTLSAYNGCDSIRTIHLTVNTLPQPDLGPGSVLCSGDSLFLFPGEFNTYLWQDNSTGKQFKVKKSGRYAVLVTNDCGARTDDVVIEESDCTSYFPTAFSPNGDGVNDVFRIRNAFNIEDFNFEVYSRWGQKIFETKDAKQGWNGYTNGKAPIVGTYIWFCHCKINGVPKMLKGMISLVN